MTHEELKQLDRQYVMQTYGRFDVDLDHAAAPRCMTWRAGSTSIFPAASASTRWATPIPSG